jgi:integrase
MTDRQVRGVKAPGLYPDGDGLYLQVTQTGSRSWLYRFRHRGRRPEIGLGSLQDVTLAKARVARDEVKRRVAAGEMAFPARTRAPAPITAAVSAPPTLIEVWTEYVEAQAPGWRGRKTSAGWMRSIEKHAGKIADKPVAEISVDDMLLVLKPLWMTKAESAGKLRERLERVLDYARVKKLRAGDNPALWRGNLSHLLPPRPKLQRGHMKALPYAELPELMRKVAGRQGMAARALEFTILTVARESMTLEATWGEFVGDVWELDASRMKDRAFRQPLSSGALAVLDKVRPEQPRPGELVFPGPRDAIMSNMAMDMLLRELAPPFTPHGMRSTFRDWAGDETDFSREVIEECLAHAVGDETERAYRRSDALKKRRAVLEAWSAYCHGEGEA